MSARPDFLALYRAIIWRLWREQRRAIVALALSTMTLLLAIVVVLAFRPTLLAGLAPRTWWLAAGGPMSGVVPTTGAAARAPAFLVHQAPYVVALFAGLSAATVASRLVAGEVDRGSLEILLAMRHPIGAIGGAMVMAAWTISGLGWLLLVALLLCASTSIDVFQSLDLAASAADLGAAAAMQLVLTLLSAQLAVIVTLVLPGVARTHTGVAADPATLIAALPALFAFLAASLCPQWSTVRLGLFACVAGLVLLSFSAVSIRLWFRPERFLESGS